MWRHNTIFHIYHAISSLVYLTRANKDKMTLLDFDMTIE